MESNSLCIENVRLGAVYAVNYILVMVQLAKYMQFCLKLFKDLKNGVDGL